MRRQHSIIFIALLVTLLVSEAAMAQTDELRATQNGSNNGGTNNGRLSATDLLNCSCPQHAGRSQNQPSTGGVFGQAGIMMLDSLPKNAAVLANLSLESAASTDTTENAGYKKYYAMIQLKAQAAQHGANALIGFRQTLNKATNKLIFSATAARVER
jgi:hypothetical protein